MRSLFYTESELSTTDTGALSRLARRAGFANAGAGSCSFPQRPIEYIIFLEDSTTTTKEELLEAIKGMTDIELKTTPNFIDILADGETTAEVVAHGPAFSPVYVNYSGLVPISTTAFNFNENGQFTLKIGPFAKGLNIAQPISVYFGHPEKIYKPTTLQLKCHP